MMLAPSPSAIRVTVMRVRSLGHEYRRAFAKLFRYSSESGLRAALGRACVNNLVSSSKIATEKTGLGPAGKKIIAHDEDVVMLDDSGA